MSIDDRVFESLQRLERDTGELVAGQKNLEKYISAVSDNGRRTSEKLDTHITDPGAHGQKAVNTSWHLAIAVVALLLTFGAFLIQTIR